MDKNRMVQQVELFRDSQLNDIQWEGSEIFPEIDGDGIDPDETLRQIFDTVDSIKAKDSQTLEELVIVGRLSELDRWLSGGGALPAKWDLEVDVSPSDKRKRLDAAREERKRWQKVTGVFRGIVKRAGLTREEMIEMVKRLPDCSEELVRYLETQPEPDYQSYFEDVLLLNIQTS